MNIEIRDDNEQTAVVPASVREAFILDAGYEIWAAFQKKFTGGERPSRDRWDVLMLQRKMSPELAQPFQDFAIEAAVEIYEKIDVHLHAGVK